MGFAKNVLLTALGLLVAILVRGAVVPRQPGPLEDRTGNLLAARATCSILFLGPSYVASMIDTDTINDEAKRIGFDARACKFGAQGLKGYELRMWIERLLAHDWPKLRLVVIDITLGDDIGYSPANWFKPRVVEWHTTDSIPWLYDFYLNRRRGSAIGRARLLASHLQHVAARYLMIGRGTDALARLRVVERLVPAAARGELPKGADRSVSEAKARKNPRGAAYAARIKRLVAAKQKRASARSDWPLELRNLVRAHGVEAYFLLAPVLYSKSLPGRAREGKDRLVVMDFNDPERYPELYVEKVRGNTSHLNDRGVPIYSRFLARTLHRLEPRKR